MDRRRFLASVLFGQVLIDSQSDQGNLKILVAQAPKTPRCDLRRNSSIRYQGIMTVIRHCPIEWTRKLG
jgi:hypothetical protein